MAIQRLSPKIRFWQPHISFTVLLCKVASQATLERIRNKTIKIENVRITLLLATFLIFFFFTILLQSGLGSHFTKENRKGNLTCPKLGFFRPSRLFQPWPGAIPSFSYPIVSQQVQGLAQVQDHIQSVDEFECEFWVGILGHSTNEKQPYV